MGTSVGLGHDGKRWILREHDRAAAARLSRSLGISPFIGALFAVRGVVDPEIAHRILHPSFDQLHDPMLMRGMDVAVQRISRAIERREKVLIYGDYDVDGTTGTALLRRALQMLGLETGYHIPHRFTEGYGINRAALAAAYEEGYDLVISVDCGIRAHEPLRWARERGLEVIVTDHHLPDEESGIPPAVAVLDPNRADCAYPDKNLAGVGVAFKLAHALLRAHGRASDRTIKGFLKLVAIGTVADVAPLIGENRAIVALGLQDLPNVRNLGLRALMEVAGCGPGKRMSVYDIGFRLGPRINAAGRMDAARVVVELLEAVDEAQARRLAVALDEHNAERQRLQRQLLKEALAELKGLQDYVAVVARDGWHRGVIGLVASKIVEQVGRPAIVISLDGEMGHGSARSIEEYHLLEGLTACADLFENFGGHRHAAGLAIRRDRIDELRRRLNEHAASLLRPDQLIPALRIDLELPAQALTLELAKEMRKLEPYGTGWPSPLFLTRKLRVVGEPRVLSARHLKFSVVGEDGIEREAIWWRAIEDGKRTPCPDEIIELVYSLEIDSWRECERLRLVVEDYRVSDD